MVIESTVQLNLNAAARDAHEAALEKAQNTATTLQRELQQLTQATDDFSKAYREYLDDIAAVTRLKVHMKNNLIYYLQAIWRYEYEDQEFMRLLGTAVPSLELESMELSIELEPVDDFFAPFRAADETLHRAWVKPKLKVGVKDRPIEEAADLGNLLGFMGNYMIFPMKKHNALTEFMVMPYVDPSFGAMDPDQLSNISLDEFERYVRNLRGRLSETAFQALKSTLQAWLELLLADPLRNGDEMIVPTGSLYIEVMASENTLMEGFKLDHRRIDVEKARAEVMAQSIDNLRRIKRVLNSELEDPDIEKVINVTGSAGNSVVLDDS